MSTTDTDDVRVLQRQARRGRQAFAREFGPFVTHMTETMDQFHAARQSGMTFDDAVAGLESVIREVWPMPTTKFGPQCDVCEDLGYEPRVCRVYARCERRTCGARGDEWTHRYVVPCQCARGDRRRVEVVTPETQLAAVGRRQKAKPRGLTRFGS